jgi:small GTP-binding protein
MKKYNIPIILLGNNKTGKTSFSSVLQNNQDYFGNYTETIGVNYFRRTIINNNKNYKLTIWDLTGSHRFIPIMDSYLNDASFIFLFFSYNDKKSIEDLSIWKELLDIKCKNTNLTVFLFGSWSDVKKKNRDIKLDYIKNVCNNMNYKLYDICSIKTESVNRVIFDILENIDTKLLRKDIDESNTTSENRDRYCFYNMKYCFGIE